MLIQEPGGIRVLLSIHETLFSHSQDSYTSVLNFAFKLWQLGTLSDSQFASKLQVLVWRKVPESDARSVLWTLNSEYSLRG